MIKLPFNSSDKKPYFLTVDIGSTELTCLAFELTGEKNLRIVGVGKETLKPGWVRGGNIVEYEQVQNAFSKAVQLSQASLESDVDEVIFGVSGSLGHNIVTTSKFLKPVASVIKEKEYRDLFDKTAKASYEQMQSRVARTTGLDDTEFDCVTTSLVYLKCDDKELSTLPPYPVKKVELALYSCFTPTNHLSVLQDLAKSMSLKIIAVSSNFYAFVEAMKYSTGDVFDCVLMDIGAENTDIGVVFGGGIVSSLTLDIGGNHFTGGISHELGIPYKEAEAIKRQHSSSNLSESESSLVQSALTDTLDIWLSGVETVFLEFTGVKTFASDIFYLGGGSKLSDINSFASDEPWTKGIPFIAPPEFTTMSMHRLKHISDATSMADPVEDLQAASLGHIYLKVKGLVDD